MSYTTAIFITTAVVCPFFAIFWPTLGISYRDFFKTAVVCYTFHRSYTTIVVASVLFTVVESTVVQEQQL